jgi:dTDP-4-dehydrorhamnose reductase
MKILLLGKNGQIGHELQTSLLTIGNVAGIGRQQMDLNHLDLLKEQLNLLKPEIVVNAAAYTQVDQAESEIEKVVALNSTMVKVLAEYCKKQNAMLVHYSTDYVFDGLKQQPYNETDQPNPINQYGMSKYLGEQHIISSDCRFLILRTSWVYSDHGHNFVKKIISLAQERDQLKIVSDQWGAPTSARMIADTTTLILSHVINNPSLNGLYHLTAAGETSWYHLASYVLEKLTKAGVSFRASSRQVTPITTEEYPSPAKRPKNSRLNNDKIEKTFGLQLPDWRVYLDQTLSKLIKHENKE